MSTERKSGRKGPRLAGVLAAATLFGFAAQDVALAQTASVAPSKESDKADRKVERKSRQVRESRRSARGKQQGTRGAAGQQASVDRSTGRLRQPTPEEARALAAGLQDILSQSVEGLEVFQLPDGTLLVDLQDRFNEVSMATIGADGKVVTSCVNDATSAGTILKGSAAAKPAPGQLEEK